MLAPNLVRIARKVVIRRIRLQIREARFEFQKIDSAVFMKFSSDMIQPNA